MEKTKDLNDCVKGGLVGCMLGEALAANVRDNPVVQPGFYCGFREPSKLTDHRLGSSSFAWQRVSALTLALRGNTSSSYSDISRRFLEELRVEYARGSAGWDRESLEVMLAFKERRAPIPPANEEEGSHGIALGIVPLVWAMHLERRRLTRDPEASPRFSAGTLNDYVWKIGDLTHVDSSAKMAAWTIASWASSDMQVPAGAMNQAPEPMPHGLWFVHRNADLQLTSTTQLASAMSKLCDPKIVADPRHLRDAFANGAPDSARASVLHAIGICLRHPHNFQGGVLEAANFGRTPGVAALVGTLLGSHVGFKRLPKYMLNHYPAHQEALDLGRPFINSFE